MLDIGRLLATVATVALGLVAPVALRSSQAPGDSLDTTGAGPMVRSSDSTKRSPTSSGGDPEGAVALLAPIIETSSVQLERTDGDVEATPRTGSTIPFDSTTVPPQVRSHDPRIRSERRDPDRLRLWWNDSASSYFPDVLVRLTLVTDGPAHHEALYALCAVDRVQVWDLIVDGPVAGVEVLDGATHPASRWCAGAP